ncbi:hypothetical protein CF392_04295 [Tamilnaduibacter salinus]|uniref:Uncharacterized protein n=1 Tax=Tamilnaduibacter salinus TaxID=1484056 RepID=A0A2A2I6N2_9GAMM|nr:hypothetical protein CF392_04295 [Tamilnaduibacter salinus]
MASGSPWMGQEMRGGSGKLLIQWLLMPGTTGLVIFENRHWLSTIKRRRSIREFHEKVKKSVNGAERHRGWV